MDFRPVGMAIGHHSNGTTNYAFDSVFRIHLLTCNFCYFVF